MDQIAERDKTIAQLQLQLEAAAGMAEAQRTEKEALQLKGPDLSDWVSREEVMQMEQLYENMIDKLQACQPPPPPPPDWRLLPTPLAPQPILGTSPWLAVVCMSTHVHRSEC